MDEWRYLLTGPTGDIHVPENSTKWLDNMTWGDIYKQIFAASELEALHGFKEKFLASPDDWRELYDSVAPESMLDKLPGDYKDKTDF